ncbi:hypothetical protein LTR17_013752 [Elasticomyces elasticus]|nr:hypothetical protein LTR17_013752 [Elasticomyces elasticus]
MAPTTGTEMSLLSSNALASDESGAPRKPGKGSTRTTKWSRTRRLISALWLLEAFYWLFALACFFAIVSTLASYDGHRLPSWPWGISLNTIVSLLASFATFALMVPVTAGLGQVKWLWFRKARSLANFEAIEGARAGPVGSVTLLLRGTGGWLACIGAIITISMLAYGPFVQQIISTPTRGVPHDGATVPIAYWYNTTFANDQADIPLNMKAAIMSGMLSTNDSVEQWTAQPMCQTGNCTWSSSYASLAVCSACVDLSTNLTATYQPSDAGYITVWQLPNGLNLSTPSWQFGNTMTVNTTSDRNHYNTVAFSDGVLPILDVFVILGNYTVGANTEYFGPYASECRIDFCLQEYNASATNGSFTETVISEPKLFNSTSSIMTMNVSDTTFTLDYEAVNAFAFYLPTLFSGTVVQSNSASPQPQWPSDMTQAIFQHLNATPHSLDSMFRNIAQSMTLAVRTQVGANTVVKGQYFTQETYIHVVWAWISLPAAVGLAVLVFLLGVVVKTRRVGLEPWKESSLATLFHGIGSADAEGFHDLLSPGDMEDVARKTVAVLVRDGGCLFLDVERGTQDHLPPRQT